MSGDRQAIDRARARLDYAKRQLDHELFGFPTDPLNTLLIDVKLPDFLTQHWPPSETEPWYVRIKDSDPTQDGHQITVDEITLVDRRQHASMIHKTPPSMPVISNKPDFRLYIGYPSVSIASVDKTSYIDGGTEIIGINGQGFQPEATARFEQWPASPSPKSFDVLSPQVSNAGHRLEGSINLLGVTAPAEYTLTVTNPDGSSAQRVGIISVFPSHVHPSIHEVTPNKGYYLTGTLGPKKGAVQLPSGAQMAVGTLHEVYSTAPLGLKTGTVPSGAHLAVKVHEAYSTATLAPSRAHLEVGGYGVQVQLPWLIVISGYLPGTSVAVKLAKAGQADIVASNVVRVDGSVSCCLNIPQGPQFFGQWDVVVTVDNEVATLQHGFTITDVPPTVFSISPGGAINGPQNKTFTISGTGFKSGAQVDILGLQGTVASMTPSSIMPTAIIAHATLFAVPPSGQRPYDLKVTNSDGGEGWLYRALEVFPYIGD